VWAGGSSGEASPHDRRRKNTSGDIVLLNGRSGSPVPF